MSIVDTELLEILRCPNTGLRLRAADNHLESMDSRFSYPVVAGIPILLRKGLTPTHAGHTRRLRELDNATAFKELDDVAFAAEMQRLLVPTCGNLFRGTSLNGDQFPTGLLPEPWLEGRVLDVGCGWGRWSAVAAAAEHTVVGVDLDLRALLCAKHLFQRLDLPTVPRLVCADARALPFDGGVFDSALSYSFVQHFAREDAEAILRETNRILIHQGKSLIQMAHSFGFRSITNLARRRFKHGRNFDVRFYDRRTLIGMFQKCIGPSKVRIDCFFGLNVHSIDRDIVPSRRRWVVDASDLLVRTSMAVPVLETFADSLWVFSEKN